MTWCNSGTINNPVNTVWSRAGVRWKLCECCRRSVALSSLHWSTHITYTINSITQKGRGEKSSEIRQNSPEIQQIFMHINIVLGLFISDNPN